MRWVSRADEFDSDEEEMTEEQRKKRIFLRGKALDERVS
jgi:hypothetical protein